VDFDKLKVNRLVESNQWSWKGHLRTVVNASRMDCSSDRTENGWVPWNIILVTCNQTNSSLVDSLLTAIAWMSSVTVVTI
jgi:hypothetical protein